MSEKVENNELNNKREVLSLTNDQNFANSVSSIVTVPAELGTIIWPMQTVNTDGNCKKIFRTYPKQLFLKNKHNKYRLIQKSPLKCTPIKSLTHMLRKHKKSKSKGISPRKLKFILPKVTKFSPRKVKQPRLLKSKSIPLLQNELFKGQKSLLSDIDISNLNNHIHEKAQDIITGCEISESERLTGSNVKEGCCSSTNLSTQIDENEDDELEDGDQQQKKEYLAAFLKASSTIAFHKSSERKHMSGISSCEQKLTKQQRRLHDRILALSYVPDLKTHQDALVLSFLLEVRDALSSEDESKFEEFVCTLESISSSSDAVELYYKVIEMLKGFPDLQDAFVMFLKPEEAAKVGRYTHYLNFKSIRTFADELKHHSSKQPQNLQKLIRTLDSISNMSNLDGEHVVTSLTPVLKLQPWLLESLSKCIPEAKPQCSLPDDFEEIDIDRPSSPSDFERIILPDEDGKGGPTEKCFCHCHSTENSVQTPSLVQNLKSEHCLTCALRFIDGRVFLQCGRTLRLAKVFYQMKEEESLTSPNLSKEKTDVGQKRDLNLKQQQQQQTQQAVISSKTSRILHKSFEGIIETERTSLKKGRKAKKQNKIIFVSS